MTHILRHGHGIPKVTDLELWQIGINEDDNSLYIRTGNTENDIHQLNAEPTLEQQEIRTWRFTDDNVDDGTGPLEDKKTTTRIVKGLEDYPVMLSNDVRVYVEHTGWDISRIKIQLLINDEDNADDDDGEDHKIQYPFIPEEGLLEVFTLKGDNTLLEEDEMAVLNVSEQTNEWIVSISETYAMKISIYKSKKEENEEEIPSETKQYQSLVVVESLGFLSQGGIVL